ncbi:hypothetical protein NM688_g5244 [Phlebia brevispora]|uniref:Uncharacterized protein n=1 Tax=Phlebia brevispora TaxID=194682 RepID=A0ACC1SYH1_9APHY|nr:hypothetical protein NM688_g5244 [Phlebia brevispora]
MTGGNAQYGDASSVDAQAYNHEASPVGTDNLACGELAYPPEVVSAYESPASQCKHKQQQAHAEVAVDEQRRRVVPAGLSPVEGCAVLHAIDTSNNVSREEPMLHSWQINDIMTVYHPHANLPPKIEHLKDHGRSSISNHALPVDDDPTSKFGTCAEFEFAEIILEAALNHKQIDRLLAVIHAIRDGASFGFHNHADVEAAWNTASRWYAPFKQKTISDTYEGKSFEFPVFYRDPWQYALDVIRDPIYASHITWDAQCLFKYNGTKWVAYVHEPYTTEGFWDAQTALPANAKPVCFAIYADKTKLSSSGTAKGYPAMGCILNTDVELRNGAGPAGGRIIGWLPIIEEDEKDKNKPAWINFKRNIWHKSFRVILQHIIEIASVGQKFICGDGVERFLFPIISILTADYEEQCSMALTRGLNGLCPCPVCLVPNKEQNNLLVYYPCRNAEEVKAIILNTALSATAKDNQLKALGMRNVYNVFWDVPHLNSYKAISFDRLHFNHIGLFADHLWKQFHKTVKDMRNHQRAMSAIDSNMAQLPRWQNFNHFSKIMGVYFADGTKHEDVSKSIVFAAHSVVTEEASPLGYLMLQCIRAYLEHDMYLGLEVHTKETIALGRAALYRFAELLHRFEERFPDKKWVFPKLHWQHHSYDDIWDKGVTRNYNTKPYENQHGEIKDTYEQRTNFKDYAQQITRINHHFYTAVCIREHINVHDKQVEDAELDNDATGNAVIHGPRPLPKCLQFGKVYLGSGSKLISFEDVQSQHQNDIAFMHFRLRFTSFVNEAMPSLNGTKWCYFPESKIQEFKFLKIDFTSKVTWKKETDYLRCNPNFYGRPQYDGILAELDGGDIIFGKLIYSFTCQIGDKNHLFALIQPFDMPIGEIPRKDKQLHLYRLHSSSTKHFMFISCQSIIRGALLVEDFAISSDYLVIDVVDSDWFLRCRETFKGYITW